MFVAIQIIWPGSGWILYSAITGSVLWFSFIFLLDRYIVAGLRDSETLGRRLAIALPRIMMGIVIGVVVATPLHLKIFETEIEKKFAECENATSCEKAITGANTKFAELRPDLVKREREAAQRVNLLNSEIEVFVGALAKEYNNKGKGPKFDDLQQSLSDTKYQLANAQSEWLVVADEIRNFKEGVGISKLESSSIKVGLLDRYRILHE